MNKSYINNQNRKFYTNRPFIWTVKIPKNAAKSSSQNVTIKDNSTNRRYLYRYIVPENYKNKRLLLNAILDYWDKEFRINPHFKNKYEEHFGCIID